MEMATTTSENGETTRYMDREATSTTTELDMTDNGLMTCSREKVWSNGLMGIGMKVNILMG